MILLEWYRLWAPYVLDKVNKHGLKYEQFRPNIETIWTKLEKLDQTRYNLQVLKNKNKNLNQTRQNLDQTKNNFCQLGINWTKQGTIYT